MSKGKWIGLSVSLLLLALVLNLTLPFATGRKRMQEFCASLEPGLTQEALMVSLQTKGLKLAMSDPNKGVIHEPRSYGRFLCEISLEKNQLIAAQYRSND